MNFKETYEKLTESYSYGGFMTGQYVEFNKIPSDLTKEEKEFLKVAKEKNCNFIITSASCGCGGKVEVCHEFAKGFYGKKFYTETTNLKASSFKICDDWKGVGYDTYGQFEIKQSK